jgi:hypothetical protein
MLFPDQRIRGHPVQRLEVGAAQWAQLEELSLEKGLSIE